MNVRVAFALFVFAIVLVLGLAALRGEFVVFGVLAVAALALASFGGVVLLERHVQAGLPAMFLVAVAARFMVTGGVNYLIYDTRPGLFAPDEIAYDWAGWIYNMYLDGKGPNPYIESSPAAPVVLAAGLYYAFGHFVLLPKLVLAVLGAWTAVFSAMIARFVFPQVTRQVGYLTALFPSLVLWSSLLCKDTFTLAGVELALVAFLYLRERFSIWLLGMFALGALMIAVNRPYEAAFVALGCGAALIGGEGRRMARNVALLGAFSIVMVVILSRFWSSPFDFGGDASLFEQVLSIRTGYALGTGSAIRHDLVHVGSVGGMLAWTPIGMAYFFFAPLPFSGTSLIALSTSPEMIMWYLLLPSIWRGMKYTLKHRARVVSPVFFYALVSSLGWSMLVTNVGTIYRYRGQVLFVPLIFFAVDRAVKRGLLGRATPEPAMPVAGVPAPNFS